MEYGAARRFASPPMIRRSGEAVLRVRAAGLEISP